MFNPQSGRIYIAERLNINVTINDRVNHSAQWVTCESRIDLVVTKSKLV
jgi:hypothetical protein